MNEMVRWQGGVPAVGTRDGNWVWDGSNWVCDPDCSVPVPCPPFGPPVFSGPAGQPPWYPGANGGVSFGQTPPPNPVRGHFFWDGVALWLFDGAAWVGIGPGTPVTPGQPSTPVVPPSTTPPLNPKPGQTWFDGAILWIWNGTSWLEVGPESGGAGGGLFSVTAFVTPGSYTFTIPNNATAQTTFKFHLQAGGGGGGGISAAGNWSAQGGGGGEYMQFGLTGAVAGQVVNCTVGAGGTAGGASGAHGGIGGASSAVITATNASVIANPGNGGWGGSAAGPSNNATEGLGGKNGTFTPGTSNIAQVLDIPGGDAALTSSSSWTDAGGSSFMGMGGPAYDNTMGWNDTTGARGFGAGGRGSFNNGVAGKPGTGGAVIIERVAG